MEKMIELLKQIQDLAGVAIDALDGAGKDAGEKRPEGKPEGGDGPPRGDGPPEGGKPPEGDKAMAEGGKPPEEEDGKRPPFGR